VEKPKKLAPVVDLMAALKQSLAQMEGRKKPAATAKSEAPAAAAGGSHGADGEVIEESRLGPPSKSWFGAAVYFVIIQLRPARTHPTNWTASSKA